VISSPIIKRSTVCLYDTKNCGPRRHEKSLRRTWECRSWIPRRYRVSMVYGIRIGATIAEKYRGSSGSCLGVEWSRLHLDWAISEPQERNLMTLQDRAERLAEVTFTGGPVKDLRLSAACS
jgi:hypothetical protein